MPNSSLARLDLGRTTPGNYAAMRKLADTVESNARASGLEPALLELVRIRASQINGCTFCLSLHTRQARGNGEAEKRLDELATWTRSGLFSRRERAALALTESVTLVHDGHVPDPVYRTAAEQFDENELAQLLWTITVINAYNRLAIATRLGH